MISVVLYGRNDNYGYNLHKRAALSFNCIAEILTDPDDEIIFVDYNTPDDFPTFPEAIQDTLTDAARRRLRVLRVRPRQHERFAHRTHLKALEPISRNVAIRRSSPANQWVLSTNTDMIFVMQGAHSLSDIVSGLRLRFYQAPRLEIPETLWESFDRSRPAETIATVRKWGRSLHLDEIVYASKKILYDGPGDFQLVARDDLFAIQGFHEDMLLGWHVDSNLIVRLRLLHGELGDLGSEVFGYHCDHTRQVTPAHSHTRVQNDWRHFVDDVKSPDIPEFATSWGLAGEDIEEIRLETPTFLGYVKALEAAIGAPLETPYEAHYAEEAFNKSSYDPRHILPFLLDMFSSARRDMCLAWFGARRASLQHFASAWQRLGFTQSILVDDNASLGAPFLDIPGLKQVDFDALIDLPDAFVFDFSSRDDIAKAGLAPSSGAAFVENFFRIVAAEQDRFAAGRPLRRLVGLNAIHNQFESLFCSFVGAGATPFSTRMRHGFVLPGWEGQQNWLPLLLPGGAGRRDADTIVSDPTRADCVAYGPYKHVPPGAYRLRVSIESRRTGTAEEFAEPQKAFLEIVANGRVLAAVAFDATDPSLREFVVDFFMSEEIAHSIGSSIETRFKAVTPCNFRIVSETAERLEDLSAAEHDALFVASSVLPFLSLRDSGRLADEGAGTPVPEALTSGVDIMPFLSLGGGGQWAEGGIASAAGEAGHIVYGPYWSLPPGGYEASVVVRFEQGENSADANGPVGIVEVLVDGRRVGFAELRAGSESTPAFANFTVPETNGERNQFELRVWTSGAIPLHLTQVKLAQGSGRSLSAAPLEWLPRLQTGPAAEWRDSGVDFLEGRRDFVVDGPAWALAAGTYRVAFSFEGITSPIDSFPVLACEVLAAGEHLAWCSATAVEAAAGPIALSFVLEDSASADVCIRVWTAGLGRGRMTSVLVEPVEERSSPPQRAIRWPIDLLPFLRLVPDASVSNREVLVPAGPSRHLFFGPYWRMPAGRYEVEVQFDASGNRATAGSTIELDAAKSGNLLASKRIGEAEARSGSARMVFDLEASTPSVEIRLWASGESAVRIFAVKLTSSMRNVGPRI